MTSRSSRRGAAQPLQLAGARVAAGEMPGHGGGRGRIARHQPVQPSRLDGGELELFEHVLVIHVVLCVPSSVSDRARPTKPGRGSE